MPKFEIKEDFVLDGKPFKILSGAIHYFRVQPGGWYHSLYNLKALGFNTVETYVPWNLHEAKEGQFDFSGILDLEKFLETAQSLGLYAIVRPSPYICAEWELGGLPAWLLTKDVRIRSSDPDFLKYVSAYYAELLPRLAKHQLDQGGNILMFQIENEYGSYGEDKAYLQAIKKMMQRYLSAPFFTSDGPWPATLRAGSMIDDDVLTTGNFGSKAKENFAALQQFFDEHHKHWPLMCMEFWDGWFNRWHEPIVQRDPEELADAVHEVLKHGSLNLYMFHGGTNFGFMNGCSARGVTDLPQITSYDYGAPLDEQGNPTAKYYALQKMLRRYYPELPQKEPLVKSSMAVAEIPLKDKVSLFSTLTKISEPLQTKYPVSMEAAGQNTGYMLYRTTRHRDAKEEKLRVIDARDRMQLYLDEQQVSTQYQAEIGSEIPIEQKREHSQLDLLLENMGRVNYGAKLLADTQHKGIRTGVMADLHFMLNWQQYPLPLDSAKNVDFSGEWSPQQPAFYRYQFELSTVADTFIDLEKFGKGVVLVNDVNLGRFWNVGPTLSLYLPKSLLKTGVNDIIIFETEGIYSPTLNLRKQPKFKKMKK